MPELMRLLETIGGEGRTRTFEAMRRLIYSQLPLPLGTLPLNSIENPPAELAEARSRMTLKPETPMTGAQLARLWGKHPGKVNQCRPLKRAGFGSNCHYS